MPKQYHIGGKLFELRPLTYRQRYLAAPFEQKLRKAVLEIAKFNPESPDSLTRLHEVSVTLDDIVFSKDEEFQRWLATILTPSDAEKWTPAMIELHKDLMWEMTEDVQAEVLRDFFGRLTNSPIASPVSIKPSMSEKKQSGTSGEQKESENQTS